VCVCVWTLEHITFNALQERERARARERERERERELLK
jgi:hypothetical protein